MATRTNRHESESGRDPGRDVNMGQPQQPRASSLHLRVFLASPGDVADERALARQVLDQLPYDPLLRGKIGFEVVAWDQPGAGVPMLATMTPQAAIARSEERRVGKECRSRWSPYH